MRKSASWGARNCWKGVRGADALLTLLTDKIDAEVFEAAGPQLKIVANMAVGYDNVDVRDATRRGIMVTNTPGVLTDATADHAWALLFAVARRVPESEKYLRAGKFKGWGPLLFLGGAVTGSTLGIVGAGRIGSAMMMKSRGFNMRVLYADKSSKPQLEAETGARRVELEELLRESDFVSLHVPLLPETVHLIHAGSLRLMKRTAYLVNTGRGPLVDEAALADALKNGVIAGAALDVSSASPRCTRDCCIWTMSYSRRTRRAPRSSPGRRWRSWRLKTSSRASPAETAEPFKSAGLEVISVRHVGRGFSPGLSKLADSLMIAC